MTREEVWQALFDASGDRVKAAIALNRSVRTVNRYIKIYDLYPDLDKNKFVRNQGPPRYGLPPMRESLVIMHIVMNSGTVDSSELAVEMYGVSNSVTLNRVYSTMHEMKAKGIVGFDGTAWFVV